MNKYVFFRSKKLKETFAVINLLSIIICSIIVIIVFSEKAVNSGFLKLQELGIVTLSMICTTILVLVYVLWTYFSKRSDDDKSVIKRYIEVSFFLVIYSVLILLTGKHESSYKFIYLFSIISSTIRFGMKLGMIVASASSAFILVIDLISQPFNTVNKHFETDLILAGVFVLTAWLLGYYVKTEEEYSDKLLALVNKDELTDLYNYRYFQESLSEAILKAGKSNLPVSLLMVDIDNFKRYNEIYGYSAGDKALRDISNVLSSNLGDEHVASRINGEDFIIILFGMDEEHAKQKAEEIRKTIAGMYFYGTEDNPAGKLTVSIGISTFPTIAKTKDELINSAGDALYRAKFLNKNRVEVYYSILEDLKQEIEEEHIDLISSLKTLISVINARDYYTYAHTERVVMYCKLLGEKLRLSDNDMKTLIYAAYLHDIGKIEIDPDVLNKAVALNDEEWEMLKKHPENGAAILSTVDSLKNVIPVILHHHERFDGKGYPAGLKGEETPYLARILAVADSFDAITSNRPYRKAKTYSEAISELVKNCYTQFDPRIVEVFIDVLKTLNPELAQEEMELLV